MSKSYEKNWFCYEIMVEEYLFTRNITFIFIKLHQIDAFVDFEAGITENWLRLNLRKCFFLDSFIQKCVSVYWNILEIFIIYLFFETIFLPK